MSDSFDLLDQLGDQKKVESLKAKIEKQAGRDISSKLDAIESEIEKAVVDNRPTEDIVTGIIESNFETLNGDVESTEKDLQELMLHLRSMLDSCGGEFAKLQELNASEQKLVDDASSARQEAEVDAKRAQEMSDAWNILFGLKNRRVRNTKEDLEQRIAALKAAEVEAQKRYRDRLKNADIGESLNRIISQVQGMVGIVEGMILDVDQQIVSLKNRKELAFETKEKAAQIMEDRKADLEETEDKLKQAENELTELPNNSPEYTEQEKKVADLKEVRAELKGKFNIALGIFQSKERFVDQIVVHLEAQTTTKNNLKQLIGQLKSDTEERVATYESGLQLIQSATAQEAASMYEEAGVKTDQKITEIAAKVLVGSEKDRIERVKKHPQRMTELHKVLVAMAEATAKYKEEDAKIMEEHGKKFGIDISETFSYKYEKGADESAATSRENNASGDKNTVNDLMD
jgi:DNA repair exonuclease SbcCD ATPase subunit